MKRIAYITAMMVALYSALYGGVASRVVYETMADSIIIEYPDTLPPVDTLADVKADTSVALPDTTIVPKDTSKLRVDTMIIIQDTLLLIVDTVTVDEPDTLPVEDTVIVATRDSAEINIPYIPTHQVAFAPRAEFVPSELMIKEKEIIRIYDSMPPPTEAPLVHVGTPQKTVLTNGLTVLLFEDHSMPIVSFYMGLNTAGRVFEKDKKGISRLTSMLLLAGVENRTKDQIVDSLAGMGSLYRMTSSSFYVSCLSDYAATNFHLFADVILRPSFPLQEFYAVKKEAIEDCRVNESNESSTLDRVYKALAFSDKSPVGEVVTPATLQSITPDDCVNYYNTYWRPNNAILLVMGDITPTELSDLVSRRFRLWEPGEIPESKISVAKDVKSTEVNFLHTPSRRYTDIIISNIADFDYNSPDVFPAIFINHIFGGNLLDNIRAKLNIVEAQAVEPFSLYPDVEGGYMCLRARVDNDDVVRTIAEKTALLHKVITEPVSEEELQKMKNFLIGDIALTFEDRAQRGAYGVATENGMVRQGFLEEVLKNINSVTSEDIMEVARKYIKPTQFRIVMQGDALQVVPMLEFAGYDVRFYDNYAKYTSRPSMSLPPPEKVSVDSVMKKYFEAMGGKEKMSSVTTLKHTYKVTMDHAIFEAQSMSKLPFYSQDQLLYKGVVYLKKTYNGNMGYTKIERMRTDLKADVVEKTRLDRSIFPLLDYGEEDFKVEMDSIVPVRGYFTYKLNVTLRSGRMQNYYISVSDGVPMRIEEVTAAEKKELDDKGRVKKYTPEKISSCTDFSSYKEIEGIKFPFMMEVKDDTGRILWELQNVRINHNIPNNDFR